MTAGGVRVEKATRGLRQVLTTGYGEQRLPLGPPLARRHRQIDVTIWKAFWRSSLGCFQSHLLPCPALRLSSSITAEAKQRWIKSSCVPCPRSRTDRVAAAQFPETKTKVIFLACPRGGDRHGEVEPVLLRVAASPCVTHALQAFTSRDLDPFFSHLHTHSTYSPPLFVHALSDTRSPPSTSCQLLPRNYTVCSSPAERAATPYQDSTPAYCYHHHVRRVCAVQRDDHHNAHSALLILLLVVTLAAEKIHVALREAA
jgi:hypothetical protein